MQKQNSPAPSTQATVTKGGYYLDDGPGDNAPADIDLIPSATLKTEKPLTRANRPYSALGQKYTPMTSYAPYVKQGMASWYGKRYHGQKTSSGEIYDMYAMTGAHTTLPIPSYVKVTNPENGKSVVVRINDRGPFKHERLIDLSYAAAYQLRLIAQGSGLVKVEAIDTSAEAMRNTISNRNIEVANNAVTSSLSAEKSPAITLETANSNGADQVVANNRLDAKSASYYVQVGAFKNEGNGELLQKKIMGLDIGGNAAVANVYNNGLYRVKIGPFDTRKEADATAGKVRKQLNISAIVTNQ
ncbi:MAG: septal ring lytic transglycosylase RlpA family protein [Methylotenera sp.]